MCPFDPIFGEVPRLRINSGDLFGDFGIATELVSFSGDGDEPPVAEFLLDDPSLTSKCLNLFKIERETPIESNFPIKRYSVFTLESHHSYSHHRLQRERPKAN